MLNRLVALSWNTFREGVRARLLMGLLGALACSTLVGALIGQLAIREQLRVLADLSAASVSLFSGLAAVVFMATSLHREIEQRTLFAVLARPVARWEVLIGKWAGAWLLLAIFALVGTGVSLLVLGLMADGSAALAGSTVAACAVAVGVTRRAMNRSPDVAWLVAGVILLSGGWSVAAGHTEEALLLLHGCGLTLLEGSVLLSVGLLFSSFSRPVITGAMTAGLWIVGRNADTLAHMSPRQVGTFVAGLGAGLARFVPNLQLYAPSRSILLGTDPSGSFASYAAASFALALAYTTGALVLATLLFSRRDVT